MTAGELAEALADLLRSLTEDEDGDPTELRDAKVTSFRRAGVLTADAGFVVELKDGAAYEITVVQSRNAHDEEDEDDSAS